MDLDTSRPVPPAPPAAINANLAGAEVGRRRGGLRRGVEGRIGRARVRGMDAAPVRNDYESAERVGRGGMVVKAGKAR